MNKLAIDEDSEFSMERFIAADEFVAKGETWHKSTFFEPVDTAECAGEEDAFDAGEGDEAGCEIIFAIDVFLSPIGFFADTWEFTHGIKQFRFLLTILDVGFDEDAVHL